MGRGIRTTADEDEVAETELTAPHRWRGWQRTSEFVPNSFCVSVADHGDAANALDIQTFRRLNQNPLHFIERDLVAGAVVQLRRSWRFVGRDGLGILDGAAVLEVSGDARGPECVAAG